MTHKKQNGENKMNLAENLRTQIILSEMQNEITKAQTSIGKCLETISTMDSETLEMLNIDFDQIQSILESAKLRTQSVRNLYKRLR